MFSQSQNDCYDTGTGVPGEDYAQGKHITKCQARGNPFAKAMSMSVRVV